MTDEQFRSGTTKIYQAVTNKLFKKNLGNPLAEVNAKLAHLEVKIQEMELNARFGDEEVVRVMRAFVVENQMLARLLHLLLDSNNITVDITMERDTIRTKYMGDFDTRKDAFFTKYEQLFMEKLTRDAKETGAEGSAGSEKNEDTGEVISRELTVSAASQTDQSS